ncbi:MAG: putative MarR family transcriptional regulator [Actinomycetia bacterium]|nr:putative MarR family transcriptional regulator [Actinomycetes bacterium]
MADASMSSMEWEGSMTQTVAFQLSKLGQLSTALFAARLAPLGLRPRHCAVLELLRGGPLAQLELARAIGVTASVVVDMLDELQSLNAVRRVRDTEDRRRQLIELTPTGRDLGRQAFAAATETDAELLSGLDPAQLTALRSVLGAMAAERGLTGR